MATPMGIFSSTVQSPIAEDAYRLIGRATGDLLEAAKCIGKAEGAIFHFNERRLVSRALSHAVAAIQALHTASVDPVASADARILALEGVKALNETPESVVPMLRRVDVLGPSDHSLFRLQIKGRNFPGEIGEIVTRLREPLAPRVGYDESLMKQLLTQLLTQHAEEAAMQRKVAAAVEEIGDPGKVLERLMARPLDDIVVDGAAQLG